MRKMKHMKRITAGLLTAVMAVGMTGCGGSGTAAENSEGASGQKLSSALEESQGEAGGYEVLKDTDGNPYDLGGMEITIIDWFSTGEEEEPASAYDEARLEYLDWIQETYNFTIKSKAITNWSGMPEEFVNYATVGDENNYIFNLYQGSALVAAMNSGLMYDLSTLNCLDFTESKWKSKVHEVMSVGGSIYGMRGIDPEPRAGVFFNKRLLEETGIDPKSLYDLQESGGWTWDKFEEFCKQVQKDTDNDGVIDQYAMTNFGSTFYHAAVYSNGGEFIGKNEEGYYNDLESDETMEALNWGLKMLSIYELKKPEDAEWNYTYTAFKNGEAAFSCAECYNIGEWKDMEDEIGFVCFPKGPRAEDYTNCYQDNVFVIPACYDANKAWKLAFAYNLYTDPVPGYEDYEAWKGDYYQSFQDTEAVDLTIQRMMNNGMTTYHSMVAGIDVGKDVIWGISKDSTPAQRAEAVRNTWQAYIDEANAK